ncbi:MAG: HEAT repeat domain-containing protein [Planctomycetia bacterium]|nr:HEAT repeat domain-containing protein [Planctomycetia bacterium]
MRVPLALPILLAFTGYARAQALEESSLREKFGADDASVRDQVSRDLDERRSSLTAPDLDVLERLSSDPDAEVARRSRDLLRATRRLQRLPRELRTLVKTIRGRTGGAEVQKGDFRTVACLWGSGDLDDPQVEDWFEEVADLPWAPLESPELQLIQNLGATPFGIRIARCIRELDQTSLEMEAAANAMAAARCADQTGALSHLLDARWPSARHAALRAVGRLRAVELRARVLELSESLDPETRAAAAEALGGLADGRDLHALKEMAGDPEPKVRASAATALAGFGKAAPIPLLEALLDDIDQECVHAAAGALARLGSKASAVNIASRCSRFVDSWFQLQDALMALDNEEAIPILLGIAEREPGKLAETALVGIWKLRDASDEERLLALLEKAGKGRRLHAAWALDEVRPRDFEDRIIKLLSDDDPAVRQFAAHVCERDLIRRAMPLLSSMLHSAHPDVRAQATAALASLGMTEVSPAIRAQLLADSPEDRLNAAFHARRLGDPAVVPELQRLLKSDRSEQRENAASALGACPDPSSIAPLLALRSDLHPAVRFRAVESLIDLGRADDVREWVLSTAPDNWAFVTAPTNLLRHPKKAWAVSAWFDSLRSSPYPASWRTLANMDAALGGDLPEAVEEAHVKRLRVLASREGTVAARGARIELVKRGLTPRSEWRDILEAEASVNSLWWGQKEVYRAFGMAENPETARKLRRPELLSRDIANEEDFARFLKSRGVELEPGPFRIVGRFSAGRETTPLQIIHMTEMSINDMAVVIEKNLVRGMRTKDAAAYWREKLPR